MENLIEVNIPEADMSEINQAITTLNEKLLPHLVNLSPGDRLELPKMGDKTVAFVTKSISHMEENPNLIPKYLEVAPVKVDLAAIEMLRKILSALKNLADMADDTMLLSGSEAYVVLARKLCFWIKIISKKSADGYNYINACSLHFGYSINWENDFILE